MTSIPTIDVLPPLPGRARDFLYGVLSWAAGLLTIAAGVIALLPEYDLERPFLIVSVVINGLWTLGGFKAKANVNVNAEG